MNLAIMQPYFFPYIGYFSLLEAADTFVVYDDVNYIKKGWINRNNFLSSTGRQLYTLPISKISQNAKICDLFLSDLAQSRAKLLKMLSHTYKKAPYYHGTIELLNDIFDEETVGLSDFLTNTLVKIKNYLKINVKIVRSSDLLLATELSSEARIIEIAKCLGARQYINAIGGVDLYTNSNFEDKGIGLRFLKHKGTSYRQFNNEHIPYLSIIDGLMFNSPEDLVNIIQNYELING